LAVGQRRHSGWHIHQHLRGYVKAVIDDGDAVTGVITFTLIAVDSFTYRVTVGPDLAEEGPHFSGVLEGISGSITTIGGDHSIMVESDDDMMMPGDGDGTTMPGDVSRLLPTDSASYTPVDADGGKYLRATVRYRDAEGSGKSEMAVTANPVQMLAAGPYDADNSGTIDSTEVLRAVVDYFADRITPAQVLEVVRRYFADN
jgi:hypothetical protein